MSIAANGQAQAVSNNCASANPTRCSAKITADQPLAVVIFEQGDAAPYSPSGSNAFRAGATTNFVPVVKNKWGSPALTTGLVVQNLDPTTAIDVTVTCYDYTTGAASNCGQKIGLAARASTPFWMGSIFGTTVFSGSAVITTNPARPIATIVQESDAANALVYAANAPLSGSLTAYAPELYGSYAPSGPRWDSGLTVQNTSSSSNATVTVTYYDANGDLMTGWTQANVVIGPRRSLVFSRWRNNLPWPDFSGSAVITSNQPIVATVNTSHTGSGDTGASYTAPNR